MKPYALAGFALLTLILALSPASAAVYVDAGSTHPSPDGAAWSSAFPTIQAAIGAGGGEIWVAKGTYNGAIVLTPNASLYGGFAGTETSRDQRDWKSNQTIIDGGGSGSVVTMSADSTIDGFVIANANTGVYCENLTATISNNTIKRNLIGIECQSGAVTIIANTLVGNTADNVFCMLGTHTILGNRITGGRTGISSCHNSPVIANNFIMGSYTGIRCDNSTASITNNSIAGCNDGIYYYKGGPFITNNIIAFNKVAAASWASSFNYSHNNFFRNTWGSGYPGYSTSVNPLFAAYELGDLHILPESACRDAGNNAAAGLPAVDFDWQPRIMNGTVDIGADESDGTVPSFAARIIYVNASAAPGGNGATWDSAYRTLQVAIDDVEVKGPAEIWVAAGTYSGSITLWPFAQLYGGFTGTETIRGERNWKTNVTTVDGAGSQYAVSGASLAGIDGFTVRNAVAGVYSEENSPSVRNCVLTGNTYGLSCLMGFPTVERNTITANLSHGILLNSGRPAITGNYITGNAGYGIYFAADSSEALVGSNIIANNSGGLLCFGSSPHITNNTIVDNADVGIRAVYASYPIVTNNILAFHSVGAQAGPSPSWATLTETRPELVQNCLYGNTSHNYHGAIIWYYQDIYSDPLFVDRAAQDYHISEASPCRYAGKVSALFLPLYDIDGHGRIYGTGVDIGADEFWPDALIPANMRTLSNGYRVRCGGVVSAVWPEFFYIQPANRTSGIRVNLPGHGLFVGASVEVTGRVGRTAGGELCINSASAALVNPGLTAVRPAGMNSIAVGGNYVWSLRNSPSDPEPQWVRGDGIDNIGLLIRVWGKVTQMDIDERYFYLDDGAALKDGTQTEVAPDVWEESIGIRISHSAAGLNPGDYLMITGISSCFKDGADPMRLVLPRTGELVVVD